MKEAKDPRRSNKSTTRDEMWDSKKSIGRKDFFEVTQGKSKRSNLYDINSSNYLTKEKDFTAREYDDIRKKRVVHETKPDGTAFKTVETSSHRSGMRWEERNVETHKQMVRWVNEQMTLNDLQTRQSLREVDVKVSQIMEIVERGEQDFSVEVDRIWDHLKKLEGKSNDEKTNHVQFDPKMLGPKTVVGTSLGDLTEAIKLVTRLFGEMSKTLEQMMISSNQNTERSFQVVMKSMEQEEDENEESKLLPK